MSSLLKDLDLSFGGLLLSLDQDQEHTHLINQAWRVMSGSQSADKRSPPKGRSKSLSRRDMAINGAALWIMADARVGRATETEKVFLDPEGRFELSLPSSWSQYTKPGAEVLFKRPDRGSTNVGVTITPVKVRKLEDFGSLEDIRERLFKAEQEKVATCIVGWLIDL